MKKKEGDNIEIKNIPMKDELMRCQCGAELYAMEDSFGVFITCKSLHCPYLRVYVSNEEIEYSRTAIVQIYLILQRRDVFAQRICQLMPNRERVYD